MKRKESYRVLVLKRARQSLGKLPIKFQQQIYKRLKDLEHTPRPADAKMLKGMPDMYRIRSGDYRIVYHIHEGEICVYVIAIGDRKVVYKLLERWMN